MEHSGDGSQQATANNSDETDNFNIPADYFPNGMTLDDYPDEHIPDPADVDAEGDMAMFVVLQDEHGHIDVQHVDENME